MTTASKVPCPACVFRGPVSLDENHKCVYCEITYEPGADNYGWIWRVVPLSWWLEEGMISEAQIPEGILSAWRAADAAWEAMGGDA